MEKNLKKNSILKKKYIYIYIYIYLNHFAVRLKDCKSTILQKT